MTTPAHLSQDFSCYSLGNTPAVNSLRDLLGEDDVNVLALACGDPRSILFTLWCEQASQRILTFACCDIEPAILARNIVLFTRLTKNRIADSDIWNIFNHFYIPQRMLGVFRAHVDNFLRASQLMDSWRSSSHAAYLKFVNNDTLISLRNAWQLYVTNDEDCDSRARKVIATLRNSFAGGVSFVGARAAGPFWSHSVFVMP